MDFGFTAEEEAFRQEIRQFLKEELPPDWEGFEEDYAPENFEFTKQIVKKLGAKGWLTLAWPKEYGGLGRPPLEQLIYKEEMAYHRVPGIDMGIGGITWIGPTLMLLGTEEQKREHLPKLAAGERWWCTAYSEPNAGSDMAAVMCRAVADGDDYIINGQKVWTSAAHIADWCWLMARTGPEEPKHKGISLLLVDMKTPGITVRPLVNMAGHHHFNEIFFDDVRVPKSNLVGEENRGWYHIVISLDFERTAGVMMAGAARRTLKDVVGFVKETKCNGEPLARDPAIRQKLAELAIEVEVARMMSYRVVWMQAKGIIPNYEASMIKVFASEAMQHVARVGTQIMGLYGQLEMASKWAPLKGRMENTYLGSVGMLIAAGTSEIQRSIIAIRGLGLPR
ncbi:MAG: acyl-CoA dehydrogenase family protein [Dehalococcoidia bacterium]